MRATLILGCLAMALAPAVLADEPLIPVEAELPDGYPWKLGDVAVTLDDKTRAYTTYDFSIGAFDASVQFRDHVDCSGDGACTETGKVALVMVAYPDANPDAEGDLVVVKGIFPRLPDRARRTGAVTVEIRNPGGVEGRSLISKGRAKLTLTEVRRGKDGSDSYGTLAATVTATVCEAKDEALIKDGACHSFRAEFVTDVQYDSV
jgi:hypothetical protein